jgi:hypothetical protein
MNLRGSVAARNERKSVPAGTKFPSITVGEYGQILCSGRNKFRAVDQQEANL